jgi:predicted regulator of Ras-like GTPase activity (Roadblock/LC7/MglB family)
METVLKQINSVPGVIGSMVCKEGGRLLANAFPPLFEEDTLLGAISILEDREAGYGGVAAAAGLLVFGYYDGRIVIKTLQEGYLFLLCTKSINLQLLKISLEVAAKKLDKLLAVREVLTGGPGSGHLHPAEQSSAAPVPGTPGKLRRKGPGVILTVGSMKTSASIQWNQMKENAAISSVLASQLFSIFRTDSIRKLKLTHRESGRSKILSVTTFERDEGLQFDDRIVLTLAAAEALMGKPGDEIIAELAAGGRFFG